MADIKEKYVHFVAPAPNVTNYAASNGTQRKLTALPVSIIKKLISQGAQVFEVKEIKDADKKVIGYEDILLTEETAGTDLGGIPVPEDAVVVPDIEDETIAKHAAEWEAHLAKIGQEIKAEQDEKQTVVPTQEDEGGTEGGGDPVLDDEDDKPTVVTGSGDDIVDSEDNE